MRAFAAACLALLLVLAAAVPHVHTGVQGAEDCAVCVARGPGDVARHATPDVRPADVPAELVAAAPGLPPVTGAPQGAVPGQSPPRHA